MKISPNLQKQVARAEASYLKHSQSQFDSFLELGGLLIKVKESLGHGNLNPWIQENLTITPRHARTARKLYPYKDAFKTEQISDIKTANELVKVDFFNWAFLGDAWSIEDAPRKDTFYATVRFNELFPWQPDRRIDEREIDLKRIELLRGDDWKGLYINQHGIITDGFLKYHVFKQIGVPKISVRVSVLSEFETAVAYLKNIFLNQKKYENSKMIAGYYANEILKEGLGEKQLHEELNRYGVSVFDFNNAWNYYLKTTPPSKN